MAKRKVKRDRRGRFGKGTAPGPGRPKGVPNKLTVALKDAIESALANQPGGGIAYLERQAQAQPSSFLALLRACLPKEVEIGQKEPFVFRWSGEKPEEPQP